MTQPSFVPIAEVDQVRPARSLELPKGWLATRPADFKTPGQPSGRSLGSPGPDAGYALRLARRIEPTLTLAPGESAEDVILGVALIASRRAAMFGRAPSIYDIRVAVTLFGLATDAPAPLRAARAKVFAGVSHDYVLQRTLVDSVPEETLRLSPDQLEGRMPADWAELTMLGGVPAH